MAESAYKTVNSWNLLDPAVMNPPFETPHLGGIKFSPDGGTACIVDNAEWSGSSIKCFDVIRDEFGRISDIGNTYHKIDAPEGFILDIGFSKGPDGYDYFNDFENGLIGVG